MKMRSGGEIQSSDRMAERLHADLHNLFPRGHPRSIVSRYAARDAESSDVVHTIRERAQANEAIMKTTHHTVTDDFPCTLVSVRLLIDPHTRGTL
jgi:hypothetical protein